MASVNKWIGIGRLGRDPEVKYLPSGEAVGNFSIACDEKWKDKNGQQQEHTEWVRISVFGRMAEIAGEYLAKGLPVYVEGRLQTRKWTDKDGNERQTTEVRGDRLQLLAFKEGFKAKSEEEPAKKPKKASTPDSFDDMEDDIPF